MDIDIDKIFNKEAEKQNYPQPIASQEEKTSTVIHEMTTEMPIFKKILIHLFFFALLSAIGASGVYLMMWGVFILKSNTIFYITLAVIGIAFFVVYRLYGNWARKINPNNIFFKKW